MELPPTPGRTPSNPGAGDRGDGTGWKRKFLSAIFHRCFRKSFSNLWREKAATHRWLLAGTFGLIHGFGFAGMLRELGLPREGLTACRLAFNVGVEVGQVIIALVLAPLLWWLAKWHHAAALHRVVSAIILLLGAAWMIDRAFAFNRMPF